MTTTVYLVSSDKTNPLIHQNPQQLPPIVNPTDPSGERIQDPNDWTGRIGNKNTDYSNTFERPLNFYGQKMEVALVQLSFYPALNVGDDNQKIPNNDPSDSIWVYLDCLDSENTRVGSEQHQLLCKDLPSKHAHSTREGQTFGNRVQIDVQNPTYVPVMGTMFQSLGIRLRAGPGDEPWCIQPWFPLNTGGGNPAPVPYPYEPEKFHFSANGTTAVLSFRPMQ